MIEDDMEDTAPEYEPVFTSVYQYYGNLLALFTNTVDDLPLQLPILIKLKVQIPMSLFNVWKQHLFLWMSRLIQVSRDSTLK